MHATMIPIDSHHDARACRRSRSSDSTSPLRSFTRQSGRVAVIATSHDTAPAGSKYFARSGTAAAVRPLRCGP